MTVVLATPAPCLLSFIISNYLLRACASARTLTRAGCLFAINIALVCILGTIAILVLMSLVEFVLTPFVLWFSELVSSYSEYKVYVPIGRSGNETHLLPLTSLRDYNFLSIREWLITWNNLALAIVKILNFGFDIPYSITFLNWSLFITILPVLLMCLLVGAITGMMIVRWFIGGVIHRTIDVVATRWGVKTFTVSIALLNILQVLLQPIIYFISLTFSGTVR